MKTNREPNQDPGDGAGFERLLARQPFRTPPPEWRDALLAGALTPSPAAARRRPGADSARHGGEGSRWPGLWDWLGSGWALGAAAWALIVVLDQFAATTTESGRRLEAPLSDAAVATIREQQRELMGQLASIADPEPPPSPPEDRPRAACPDRGILPVGAAVRWVSAGGGRETGREAGAGWVTFESSNKGDLT